jgi:hypothetical protein
LRGTRATIATCRCWPPARQPSTAPSRCGAGCKQRTRRGSCALRPNGLYGPWGAGLCTGCARKRLGPLSTHLHVVLAPALLQAVAIARRLLEEDSLELFVQPAFRDRCAITCMPKPRSMRQRLRLRVSWQPWCLSGAYECRAYARLQSAALLLARLSTPLHPSQRPLQKHGEFACAVRHFQVQAGHRRAHTECACNVATAAVVLA